MPLLNDSQYIINKLKFIYNIKKKICKFLKNKLCLFFIDLILIIFKNIYLN